MATQVTFQRATPYSLVYKLLGDGTPGAYTFAAMIADMAAAGVNGPLRQMLERVDAGAGAGVGFNLPNALSQFLRVRHVEGVNDAIAAPANYTVVFTAHELSVDVANLGEIYIELRMIHSIDR